MSIKYRTAKRRVLLTRAIRDTFGVQLQSVHANGTRCVAAALLSLHATVVSILAEFVVSTAFIFFNRSGRLRSPLHKGCHLSVRMPVLRKRARMQRFPPQTKQWYGRGKLHFFVKRSTLCRSFVRFTDLPGSYLVPLFRRPLLGSCRLSHRMPAGLIVPGKRVQNDQHCYYWEQNNRIIHN